MTPLWIGCTVTAGLGMVAGAVWGWRRLASTLRETSVKQAREMFQLRREWLEAEFVKLASQSGKPRGLIWADCDFDDEVRFARDRATGALRALVAVTISFEARPGGGMEHVEAVGNLRAATAVFAYERNAWRTDGRAVFNLSPLQTIKHFEGELELVE